MKKVYLSFGVLLSAIAFTSCDQAEMLNGGTQANEATSMTIQATNLQTRTAIDGLTVKWAEGDQVGMFCGGIDANTTNVLFNVTPGEDGGNATLKSDGDMHWAFNEDTYVYGYYPYSNKIASGTAAVFSLPLIQEQVDAKASQLSKYDYLVAAPVKSTTGENINVTFDHVMSWLDFEVTNDDNKDITLESIDLNADNSLISAATIDLSKSNDAEGYMAFTTTGTTSKLSVNATPAEGDTWNVIKSGETVTLRMAMFPTDLTGKSYTIVAHTSAGDFTVNKEGKNIEKAKRYKGKVLLFFPELAVSTLENYSTTGGKQTLTITTNMPWSIDADKVPSYVHISAMSGDGNSDITVTLDAMASTDKEYSVGRGVKIPVVATKGEYSLTQYIDIRQNGNDGVNEIDFKGEIHEMGEGEDL